jgi:hypothetical protein
METLAALRSTLKTKATLAAQTLETDAQKLSRSLSQQRAADLESVDRRHTAILADFLTTNEVTKDGYYEMFVDFSCLNRKPVKASWTGTRNF